MIPIKYLKMMKYLYLALFLYIIILPAQCQNNFYYSQYFQVAPAINPAFTGIDNFLDVKVNYRNQWTGFNDSPSTNYIGINGNLNKQSTQSYREYSLRISNPAILDSLSNIKASFKDKLKHGIGGYIIYDRQGPFEQFSANFNYALHIPISYQTHLSVGLSASIVNNRINLAKISLRDDPDDVYNELVAQGGKNTYFDLNPGFAIYSEKWYVSYAAFRIFRTAISADEVLDYDNSIDHNILMGIRFDLNRSTKLLPSIYYKYNNNVNNLWEANVKMMFNEKPWFGVSYRSTNALVFMAGVYINNLINVSYSYDYLLSNINNYINGSHELHIGLMLNKKDLKSPYLW